MLKIYGSPLCKDCVACKAAMDAQAVPYEFIDITGAMPALKEFLAIRDAHTEFDGVRKNKGVGIPCLIRDDGTLTLDYDAWLVENGYLPAAEVPAGQSCGLDGKGC